MYDYIAIERTYGSGGHKIAEQLAKKLNYRLYDRSVVVETCKRMGLDYDVVSGMDEQNPVKTFFNAPGDNPSMEEKIYNTEVDIIKEAAEQPGCVFVGRGASEILKDKRFLRYLSQHEIHIAVTVLKTSKKSKRARLTRQ